VPGAGRSCKLGTVRPVSSGSTLIVPARLDQRSRYVPSPSWKKTWTRWQVPGGGITQSPLQESELRRVG